MPMCGNLNFRHVYVPAREMYVMAARLRAVGFGILALLAQGEETGMMVRRRGCGLVAWLRFLHNYALARAGASATPWNTVK